MIIKNKTGGPATLPSVNVTSPVPVDGTVDLQEDLGNGISLNTAADLHADEGLRNAIESGEWVVVLDGEELDQEQSLAAVTTAAQVFEGVFRVVSKGDKRRAIEVTNVVVQGS